MISVPAARTIVGRIAERHGTEVPGLSALGLTQTFPSATVLADADLDGIGLTGRGWRRCTTSPAPSPTDLRTSTARARSRNSWVRSGAAAGSVPGAPST